ncbi:MAG: thioredoxin fold domain-containing protein [Ectothiorhodospiraceae bacterium]|nr:thioredoxin fold domain-containing protein [Ectothiorhodospiraceae bacterium]
MRFPARLPMFLLVVTLVSLAIPVHADPPKGYAFVDYEEGLRLAAEQERRIFLYFGRYGCGWCDKTNKETFSDADLRELYSQNYVLVYVDAEGTRRLTLPDGERITEMELGARLNVFATPVFGYLEPDGRVILTVPGYKTVQDFRDYDRYVSGGHYRKQKLLEFLAGQS